MKYLSITDQMELMDWLNRMPRTSYGIELKEVLTYCFQLAIMPSIGQAIVETPEGNRDYHNEERWTDHGSQRTNTVHEGIQERKDDGSRPVGTGREGTNP